MMRAVGVALAMALCLSATPAFSQDFPVGIFAVGIVDFPKVAAAGFRIVHNYAFESNENDDNPTINNEAHIMKFLDAAKSRGLQMIVGFSRNAVKRSNLEYVRRRVACLKDHPALFGWYLYDEPEREAGKAATPADLKRVYDSIKALDGKHPVIISTYSVVAADNRYWDAMDIIATDQYPIPSQSPDQILTRLDPAARAARTRGKSAWSVIQAHDTGLYGLKKRTRYPTREEMRFMAYISAMHGAKGLLFYCYNDGINNIGVEEAGAHWDNVASVATELTALGEMLSSPTKATLSPLPTIVLEQWTKEYSGAVYIIVVNRSQRVIRTAIKLGGTNIKDGALKVLFENRSVPVSGGSFSDAWKPYDVHVYSFVVRS